MFLKCTHVVVILSDLVAVKVAKIMFNDNIIWVASESDFSGIPVCLPMYILRF